MVKNSKSLSLKAKAKANVQFEYCNISVSSVLGTFGFLKLELKISHKLFRNILYYLHKADIPVTVLEIARYSPTLISRVESCGE